MKTLLELIKDSPAVKKAYEMALVAHKGQKRASGEDYITHPMAVAQTVLDWHMDEPSVIAALLHDTVEDTALTSDKIKKEFGEKVAFLVNGVTKLGHAKYRGEEREVENMRKFMLAVGGDIRVVLIKLADRLHNMTTIKALKPEKQMRIALETLEVYAVLADRLGMYELASKLEEISFPIAKKKEYEWMIDTIKDKYEERVAYANKIKPVISKLLTENGINFSKIDIRAKKMVSLYRKLLKYEMNLERVYDLIAIRCIVDSVPDCYAALGVIHESWLPLPGRIKDYIAFPKANGYRSLHTTVFGPEEKVMEVQIRTAQMHDEAENGISAHWAYQKNKDTKNYISRGIASFAKADELQLIKQLKDLKENAPNAEEFATLVKSDFLEDRILTLTPKGKVIELPSGATPVDFAYHVHSEIGNTCMSCRVNGLISPLSTPLKSGDVVEILTQKNKRPGDEWLQFVKTSVAREHIKKVQKDKNKVLYGEILKKYELRLIVEDRVGLLNDVTNIIARMKININHHESREDHTFANHKMLKIGFAVSNYEKSKELGEKIRKLKGVKSVECHPYS